MEKLKTAPAYYKRDKRLLTTELGKIYLYTDTRTKEPVLVKKLHPAESELADFHKEAEALGQIVHPSVVRCRDHFVVNSRKGARFFLVLECCAGGSLLDVINDTRRTQRPVPEATVRGWLTQLAAGLRYIHSRKCLHLNLTPGNVMLDASGNAKILDFGPTRLIQQTLRSQSGLRMAPCYTPPEIFEGESYGTGVDVWQLGCMMYEICTLKAPFSVEVVSSSKSQVCDRSLFPDPIPNEFSPGLRGLVGRMLAKDKSVRISVEDVLNDGYVRGTQSAIEKEVERREEDVGKLKARLQEAYTTLMRKELEKKNAPAEKDEEIARLKRVVETQRKDNDRRRTEIELTNGKALAELRAENERLKGLVENYDKQLMEMTKTYREKELDHRDCTQVIERLVNDKVEIEQRHVDLREALIEKHNQEVSKLKGEYEQKLAKVVSDLKRIKRRADRFGRVFRDVKNDIVADLRDWKLSLMYKVQSLDELKEKSSTRMRTKPRSVSAVETPSELSTNEDCHPPRSACELDFLSDREDSKDEPKAFVCTSTRAEMKKIAVAFSRPTKDVAAASQDYGRQLADCVEDKVWLNSRSLDDDQAAAIARGIRFNKKVRELYVSDNHIGDKGAIALAEALEENHTLVKLMLWKNKVGDAGAKALAKAIGTNTTLKSLDLGMNSILEEGRNALTEVAKTKENMFNLHL